MGLWLDTESRIYVCTAWLQVTEQVVTEQDEAVYCSALEQLNLSQQQQDDILACHSTYSAVTSRILRQLSQLQTDMKLWTEQRAERTTTGASDSRSLRSMRAKLRQLQQLMYEQQQEQDHHLMRLRKTLGKQFTVAYLAMFSILGNLSWRQVAQLALVCFPHPADPLILASVLHGQTSQRQ